MPETCNAVEKLKQVLRGDKEVLGLLVRTAHSTPTLTRPPPGAGPCPTLATMNSRLYLMKRGPLKIPFVHGSQKLLQNFQIARHKGKSTSHRRVLVYKPHPTSFFSDHSPTGQVAQPPAGLPQVPQANLGQGLPH